MNIHDQKTDMIWKLFKKSLIILAVLIILIFSCSCSTIITTNYKISTSDRNYYTNSVEVSKDTIYFHENGRGSQKLPTINTIIIWKTTY